MNFTDSAFPIFLVIVLVAYWSTRRKGIQNAVLLVSSYVFYGYVHPWICVLVAGSTVVDFVCGLLLDRSEKSAVYRRSVLAFSLVFNLGTLGVFKYFDFFVTSAAEALTGLGLEVEPLLLRLMLPAGISFYTFQTLSYTIDIYRGETKAQRNFLDFAVFVSFFPQLVAGPIERASRFLPQIAVPRRWNWDLVGLALPLLISGFFKKLVVADNLAPWVQQVYMLKHPSAWILACGTIAFAIQILADFSAYTDIARGTARLLGIELIENFKAPYLALTPSDFWRRWHISLSTWIRDYVYIPLGGSRLDSAWSLAGVLLVTFGLSGLWHGAAWNFVAWGLFHAILLIAFRAIGMDGRWTPANRFVAVGSWSVTICLVMFGWMLFRSPSIHWLAEAMLNMQLTVSTNDLFTGSLILGYCLVYSLPWLLIISANRLDAPHYWQKVGLNWAVVLITVMLANQDPEAFIYFQF